MIFKPTETQAHPAMLQLPDTPSLLQKGFVFLRLLYIWCEELATKTELLPELSCLK